MKHIEYHEAREPSITPNMSNPSTRPLNVQRVIPDNINTHFQICPIKLYLNTLPTNPILQYESSDFSSYSKSLPNLMKNCKTMLIKPKILKFWYILYSTNWILSHINFITVAF